MMCYDCHAMLKKTHTFYAKIEENLNMLGSEVSIKSKTYIYFRQNC